MCWNSSLGCASWPQLRTASIAFDPCVGPVLKSSWRSKWTNIWKRFFSFQKTLFCCEAPPISSRFMTTPAKNYKLGGEGRHTAWWDSNKREWKTKRWKFILKIWTIKWRDCENSLLTCYLLCGAKQSPSDLFFIRFLITVWCIEERKKHLPWTLGWL
jgi:hypothetical protein